MKKEYNKLIQVLKSGIQDMERLANLSGVYLVLVYYLVVKVLYPQFQFTVL